MILQRIITLLFLTLPAYSANIIYTVAPFERLTLAPNQYVQATYSFGTYPVIYCYENNLQIDPPVGSIQWYYHGQLFSGTLSTTPLIVSGLFEGSFADPEGTLIIQNISTIPIVVGCQFAF